jgi:hypothetical protein
LLSALFCWSYGTIGSIQADGSDILNQVIANQKKTDAALDIYERIERVEIRKTAGDPKPPEEKVWRVFPAGTGTDKILMAPDGTPRNATSYRADLEKLERLLAWAAQQGPGQQEAYARLDRRRMERNDLIDTTHQAFVFTKVGEESRGDRKLLRYTITPNPSFKPTSRNAMLFTKVSGIVWVDEESRELARIEGTVTGDISLALFLAKVYKGSHFMQERYEMVPGIWLPSFQQYDFDGRKFLIPFSIHERTFFTNYRRVGPPKEALEVVRGELGKRKSEKNDP